MIAWNPMTRFFKFSLHLFLFLFVLFSAFSIEPSPQPDYFFEKLKSVLKQCKNLEKYDYTSEIYNSYSDLKNYVQIELQTGAPINHLDDFLFLDGVIMGNIESLQSLLFSTPIESVKLKFQDFMDDSTANLLSYALKLNRSAIKTEITLVNFNKNCFLFRNNQRLFGNHFYQPAGVPFYLSAQCENHSFSVDYIPMEDDTTSKTIKIKNLKILSQDEMKQYQTVLHFFDPEKPGLQVEKSLNFKPENFRAQKENTSVDSEIPTENLQRNKKNNSSNFLLPDTFQVGVSSVYGEYLVPDFQSETQWIFFPYLQLRWKYLYVGSGFSRVHFTQVKLVHVPTRNISISSSNEESFFVFQPDIGYIFPHVNLTEKTRLNFDIGLHPSFSQCSSCDVTLSEWGLQSRIGLEYSFSKNYSSEMGTLIQDSISNFSSSHFRWGAFVNVSFHP